jgi:hypothetical protein
VSDVFVYGKQQQHRLINAQVIARRRLPQRQPKYHSLKSRQRINNDNNTLSNTQVHENATASVQGC